MPDVPAAADGRDVWGDFLTSSLHGSRVSVTVIGSMSVARIVADRLRDVEGLVFVSIRESEDDRFSVSDGCKLVIDGVYVFSADR